MRVLDCGLSGAGFNEPGDSRRQVSEMNDRIEEIDERALDLLVDGELSQDERRRVLTGLDRVRDGWRRCALAFLEAQEWRTSVPAIVRQGDLRQGDLRPPRETVAEVIPLSGPKAASAWRVWRPRVALAASFLMAFTLGMALRSAWLPEEARGPSAALTGEAAPQVVAAPLADSGRGGAWYDDSQMHRLKLRPVGSSTPREIDYPMYDPARTPRGALVDESAVPLELVRELERQGHDVRQYRDWVPVQLDDGRMGLVPVDRADVRVRDLDEYQ